MCNPAVIVAMCLMGAASVLATTRTESPDFRHELGAGPKPWTNKRFLNDPQEFQFAILADRMD